jgi:hypothetical protein
MIDTIHRAYDARGKGDIDRLMVAFHPNAPLRHADKFGGAGYAKTSFDVFVCVKRCGASSIELALVSAIAACAALAVKVRQEPEILNVEDTRHYTIPISRTTHDPTSLRKVAVVYSVPLSKLTPLSKHPLHRVCVR